MCSKNCPGCRLFRAAVNGLELPTLLQKMKFERDEDIRKTLGECGMMNSEKHADLKGLIDQTCSCVVDGGGCPTDEEVKATDKALRWSTWDVGTNRADGKCPE